MESALPNGTVRHSSRPDHALGDGESLHAGFEQIAALHASQTALIASAWRLTYAELNQAANRLAHVILARGIAKGERIVVLMQHDVPAVVAMIAALKSGCIAVALNPINPLARLRELIDDCAPALIVTDAENGAAARALAAGADMVIDFSEAGAAGPDHNPCIAVESDQQSSCIPQGPPVAPKG